MPNYARIEGDRVAEVFATDGDITKMFHPDLVWKPCGGNVGQGWTYDGATFHAPQEHADPQALRRMMTEAVQAAIDAVPQAWGYDSALSAVSYVDDPHPQFDAEARAVRTFRSECWTAAGTALAEVEAGTRQIPTVAQLLSELPAPPSRPVTT